MEINVAQLIVAMISLYPKRITSSGVLLCATALLQPAWGQCPAGSVSNTAGNYNNGKIACISESFNGNIKITNGGKLVIVNDGSFTGTIEGNPGSVIEVKAGGVFNPGTANNLASTITVEKDGKATLSNAGFANGFAVTNSGTFTWGSFNQNHAITVTNTACGTMIFTQAVNLQNGTTINNNGTMSFQALNSNSGTTLNNRGKLTVAGDVSLSGFLNNQWQAVFKGNNNNFNNGDSIINLFTLVFAKAIQGSFKMRNDGLFWIGGSFQYNGGAIKMNRTNAQVRVNGALSNNGNISGIGEVYVAGAVANGGAMAGKSSTDKLRLNQNITTNTTNTQYHAAMVAEDTTTFQGGAGNPDVSCSALLPMIVSSLKGAYNGSVVNLSWFTTAGINSRQFVVEYSTDGLNFAVAGTVAAKGNSMGRIDYHYQFTKINSATLYFRLMLEDRDGYRAYSNPILVTINSAPKAAVAVYPNPFARKLEVSLTLTQSLPVSVRLLDMKGRQVISRIYTGQRGFNKWTLSGLDKLTGGLYILEIMAGEEKWMQKVIR